MARPDVPPRDPAKARLEAMAALAAVGWERTQREIIRIGADVAQHATQSAIAYLHFLNEDERSIELGAWSSDTLAHCTAVYDRHYPVAEAGIWADSVRTRRPVVHNDYGAEAHRRGLPDGHVALVRHLGVPIEEGGRVRLLLGVGNKAAPYDDDDVTAVQLVGRRIWELLRARHELERLHDLEARFRHLQRMAAVTAWEYDPDEDRLSVDEMFASIFRVEHPTEVPSSLHQFLTRFAPEERDRVRAMAESRAIGASFDFQADGIRVDGETFRVALRADVRERDVGHGVTVVGVLQDLTERSRLEHLRHDAETDDLTELPNRRRLQAVLEHPGAERRRAGGAIAFHYIDLDYFKPVNDAYGHAAGDEVLRVISRRLLRLVRHDDLVARLGGDEFAVVQMGVAGREGAVALAEKIIAACSREIPVGGVSVKVGASVGIALCSGTQLSLPEISARADRALYRAKQSGRGCVVVDDA
ncbi:MAG TPA: sensor domain-containing diguanylate cyclase [Gemmatimonadaceae bacterium]|nr:sensor domain-containing diguanylate cyclase [Gemmatimonadaceae bacterium]